MTTEHSVARRRTWSICLAAALGALSGAMPLNGPAAVDAAEPWQTLVPIDGHAPSARHESGLAAVNGQLWLFGGRGQRPVESWSAGSNRWRNVTSMPAALHHFQPAVIGSDIFLIGALIGGYPNETPVKEIYRFDTLTETWSVIGEVPADRRRGGAGTAVRGDWIYLVGGNTLGHNGGAVGWLDRFRPADGTWQTLADAPNARDHFSAGFASGLLVAAGGRATDLPDPFDNTVGTTDVYDPVTGRWAMRADIPTQRAGTLAVAVCDELIVAGGEDTGSNAQASVEAYNVADDAWRELQPMGVGRHSGGGALLNANFHIVAGSSTQGGGGEVATHEFLSLPLDSDCDGLSDDAERSVHGTDPLVADTDRDDLSDGDETVRGTDPRRNDSDEDRLGDGREVALGTDPLEPDSDADGLDDARELELGTDPLDRDSDDDGFGDAAEVAAGSDPLAGESMPTEPLPVEPEANEPEANEPETDEPETDEQGVVQPETATPSRGGGGAPGPIGLLLIAMLWRARRADVHHCPQSAA